MSKVSITLHDLTIEQANAAMVAVQGGTVTLNGQPATDAEVEKAVTDTLGIAGSEQTRVEPPAIKPGLFDAPQSELDVKGLPWDKRIHASTKTKTKDGSWKKKKGVSAEEVEAVEAELLGNAPVPPVPPAASTTTPTPPTVSNSEPVAPVTPPAPPVNMTFNDVMQLATQAMSNGDIEMDEITELVKKHGGGDLGLQSLIAAPQAINGVYTELKGWVEG